MDKILSIIVPSYNMEAYLPKCLGSLIIDDKELLQKLDVIVVNDGSKDRTSEIAHEFEAKYPGVFRVIDKENGNYGSCINAALPVVNGEFVKVLDADDSFETINFSKFLGCLQILDISVDLVITDYDTVDENGVTKIKTRFNYPSDKIFDIDDMLTGEPPFVFMHAITYRTKLLVGNGYKQTGGISHTDMQWASLPFTSVKKIYYLPKVIYKYFLGRTGQTVDNRKYVTDIWMQGRVAIGILESPMYNSLPQCPARIYIDRIIVYLLRSFYVVTIFNARNQDTMERCRQIDLMLKSVSCCFYQLTDKWFISRRFRFHYVRIWRQNGIVNNFILFWAKMYYQLTRSRVAKLFR